MLVMNAVPLRAGIGVRPQSSKRLGSLNSAAQALNISMNAFGGGRFASGEFGQGRAGVASWISGINAANWTQVAYMISSRTATEINNLTYNVIGQLDSDEGDGIAQALRQKWIDLKAQADAALENPPGWFSEQATSFFIFARDFTNGALFERDFVEGAQAAWRYLMEKGISLATPVLQTFHASANRILELKRDIAAAKSSGKFPQAALMEQQVRISEGEAALNRARSSFATLSAGGSLDTIAQQAFGNYTLGAGAGIPIALGLWAVIICSAAVLVYIASSKIDAISAMFKDAMDKIFEDPEKVRKVAAGALALVFIVGIPLLLEG